MSNHRVLDAAKEFMRAYMADGRVRQPTDFDDEIMGGCGDVLTQIMLHNRPAWNATVFCKALGELVDAGEVRAWQSEEGAWFYQTVGAAVSPAA